MHIKRKKQAFTRLYGEKLVLPFVNKLVNYRSSSGWFSSPRFEKKTSRPKYSSSSYSHTRQVTVTCKRIVAKVYGLSYAKPLFKFEAKLGKKEQNAYKNSNKRKNWRCLRLTCAQIQFGLLNDQSAS